MAKKNYDQEVYELPELEGIPELSDLGADLFSSDNLKFMLEVAAGGSLAVMVSNIVDTQIKKIATLGPYLKYLSPAVPFGIALLAAKFVVPNPRWRDVGVGMIAASAGMGLLQIAKNYGILKAVGLEGVMDVGDIYIPNEPLLSGLGNSDWNLLPAPEVPTRTVVDEAAEQFKDEEAEMFGVESATGFGDVMLVDPAFMV